MRSNFDNPEASFIRDRNISQDIQEQVAAYLTLPEKRDAGNQDKNLAKGLGSFLVDQGYISEIDMWRGSWGCKYENKKIYLNELPMPDDQYNYYIFRLGENSETGKELFPTKGEEADQYRFLHETSHAYQEFLMDKESSGSSGAWYNKVLSHEIDSNLGLLFEYCYKKRNESHNRGLSTWGNVPDYNNVRHLPSQNAVRAIEDANELVTMYLWHPEYLDTFFDYVSGKIPGYDDSNLQEDKLTKITEEERESLKILLEEYITEMKNHFSEKQSNP